MGKLKRAWRDGVGAAKKEWSKIGTPIIPFSSPVKYVKTGFGPGPLGRFLYGLGSLLTFSIFWLFFRERTQLPIELPEPQWMFVIIISILLLGLTGVTGRAAENIYKKINQKKRDKRSELILSQAKHGIVGHYSLYLRSFATTDQMRQRDKTMGVGPAADAFDPRGPVEIDLETTIAEAVEDEIPLVALGRPGEHTAAGRVAIDEEYWQQNVTILANKALLLLVLPFPSPGTQWEIEWILNNGRLSHSIFIMPPEEGKRGSIDWKNSWKQLRPFMADKKLALPNYIKTGMLFMFEESGEVSKSVGIGDLKDLIREISF